MLRKFSIFIDFVDIYFRFFSFRKIDFATIFFKFCNSAKFHTIKKKLTCIYEHKGSYHSYHSSLTIPTIWISFSEMLKFSTKKFKEEDFEMENRQSFFLKKDGIFYSLQHEILNAK